MKYIILIAVLLVGCSNVVKFEPIENACQNNSGIKHIEVRIERPEITYICNDGYTLAKEGFYNSSYSSIQLYMLEKEKGSK